MHYLLVIYNGNFHVQGNKFDRPYHSFAEQVKKLLRIYFTFDVAD
jgi:hypothetical protein